MSIRTKAQPSGGSSREPMDRARELVAFWHGRWGACERLNDVPWDSLWLFPWVDDLAIFDVVDHGTDFRARQMGEQLEAFLGGAFSGTMLSEFPLPHRQRLRQVLLRASMVRAPAVERHDSLIDGHVRSCIACAIPVSGGYYQPTHLLLAVFSPAGPARPISGRFPPTGEFGIGPSQNFPRRSNSTLSRYSTWTAGS